MIICLIVIGMLSIALVRHILYFIYYSNYEKYDKLEDSIGYIAYGDSSSDRATKKKFYTKQRVKFRELADNLAFDGEFSSFKSIICSFNAAIGVIAAIIIGFGLLITYSPNRITRNLDLLAMDRQSIEYRLEQLESVYSSNLYLYKDTVQEATDFNKTVYTYKWQYNNPWTSWFTPKAYTQLEPIDYACIIESTKSNIE